jgi:hypothetical protein
MGKREKRNCMVYTGYEMVLGGELKDSRTDGTRITALFVKVTVWWVVT